MAPVGTIYSYPNNPRVAKSLIAAAFNDVEIAFKETSIDTDAKTPEYLAKFPTGKVPAFEGADGVTLVESNAIAYYIASLKPENNLVGADNYERAQVQQWLAFADNEIQTPLAQWLAPINGKVPFNKIAVDVAVEKVKRGLDILDKVLLTRTYLVGEYVTLADIVVVCALVNGYKRAYDPEFRATYKNVNRYFNTLINHPKFKAALGEIAFAEAPLKYVAPKKEVKKEPKKEAPKKEAPKKEKKKEEEEELDEPKPEPKPKSKLDSLPPSKFIMDEWKRMYSNNDTDVAMKWFWEHHDPEGYSLWRVDYKYNDELTKVFMSSNLIGGFFNRLERARKYAFGSLIVRGGDNNNNIAGYFLIRSQEIPEEVWDAADYESYNFVKIEPAQYEASKKDIEEFWGWTAEGFADGKVFK